MLAMVKALSRYPSGTIVYPSRQPVMEKVLEKLMMLMVLSSSPSNEAVE